MRKMVPKRYESISLRNLETGEKHEDLTPAEAAQVLGIKEHSMGQVINNYKRNGFYKDWEIGWEENENYERYNFHKIKNIGLSTMEKKKALYSFYKEAKEIFEQNEGDMFETMMKFDEACERVLSQMAGRRGKHKNTKEAE